MSDPRWNAGAIWRRLPAGALALSFALSSCGRGDPPARPPVPLSTTDQAELGLAAQDVLAGRPEAAWTRLAPLLDRPPVPPEVQFVAAQAAYDLQRYPEAVDLFRAAVDGRPEFLRTSSSLGFALYKLGRNDEALATFRQIVGADGQAYKAHYGQGLVQLSQGHLPEAREALERSLAIRPDYLKARFALGRVEQEEGQLERARQTYEAVLAKWPSHEEALFRLAQVQQDLGLVQAAEATLQRRQQVYALKEDLGGLIGRLRGGDDSRELRRRIVELNETLQQEDEAFDAARAGLTAYPDDAWLAQAARRLAGSR